MEYLQQVHEDQRGQQRQQDQQGPRIGQKTKEQILSMVQFNSFLEWVIFCC